jgi:hypothetical protein
MSSYTSPVVRTLGTVQELTEQNFNKVGATADAATQVIPSIVGSLVAAP